MRTLAIIPARYASTRFPGKPLVDIMGKSMVQRVYEQAQLAGIFDAVLVATDAQQIFDHVVQFGGKVMMTAAEHNSGTDRCGEVVNTLAGHFDVVFNIQGDEPFIQPEQLRALHVAFQDPDTGIATLAKKIQHQEDLQNPNIVKVVFNKHHRAMYFSRSPIPYPRNAGATYFKHIGLYAFRTEVLKAIVQLPASEKEYAESLEQLRWLDNGYAITIVETELETIGIDTPEDLKKISEK